MSDAPTQASKTAVSTRDLIVPYEGALAPELCREILQRFENDRAKHDSVTAAGKRPGRQGTMVRMSSDPGWAELKRQVTEKTVACMHDYAERHQSLRFILNREEVFLSSPVIERLDPGQGFRWHIDSGPRNTADRFLSSLTYLNDVAEGGCTEFPLQGLDVQPRAGTMVLFPPFWIFPHRGAPPVKEVKYKMTAYFTIAQGKPA